MNEQKKTASRRVRFTWIDGVIIFLIVICILGVIFRYPIMDKLGLGADYREYRIKFSVTAIDAAAVEYLNNGDSLYFADGQLAGTLCYPSLDNTAGGNSPLECRPASVYVDNGAGDLVWAQYPEGTKVDAVGAFDCVGAYDSDLNFNIDGKKKIAVGHNITVYTDTVTLYITITEIISKN